MATQQRSMERPVRGRAGSRVEPRPQGPEGRLANPPAGAKLQVARYLGVAKATEEQLLNALVLVAERHERNYDMAHGTTTLAVWSREHLAWLQPVIDHYGDVPSEQPEALRAALLGGTRAGVVGELADLTDLAVLAEQAEMTWTILLQGAKELRDEALADLAGQAHAHSVRQISWIRTEIDHLAPDALSVPLDVGGQAAISMPKRLDAIASIPDWIWAPSIAAFILLVVGAFGVAVGRPWLGPSLGPSAVLVAMTPAHPSARGYNTLVGHVGGLLAGFAAVVLVGAVNEPVVLTTGILTWPRVAAAVIAIALTILVGIAARASHPPAAATTLLVALGTVATLDSSLALIAGVALVALLGEVVRRLRLERVTPSERRAPAWSTARRWLREG
ncbi:MAG: HPP family protein [Chloroflexota bacterium]